MPERLTRSQRTILCALLALVPLFGALVVWRSAYMENRHTDFEVYARAGWAVQAGHDIYEVTADGLHYCYPPPFAIAMTPFAEPPNPSEAGWYLPFGVSVGLWYLLSVGFAFTATHWLATAVESTYAQPISLKKWWAIRIWPVLLTLPALGNSWSHGQTNTLLFLLIAGAIAAWIRCRSGRAGAWLAGAIALKVIPAFLLLIPLLRRDRRCFAGLAIGLVVVLGVIPAIVFGPSEMLRANRRFIDVMIQPALVSAIDADRSQEMFHVLRTDNQSIQAVLHAWQHWANPNAPAEPSGLTRAAHWVIGGLLTIVTLFSARGRRLIGNDLLLFSGALIAVMLLISPMCHLHYYCLTLPLVMGLLFATQARHASWLALHVVGGAFPLIFEEYRNLGFAPLTTLPLWCLAVNDLRRRQSAEQPADLRKAA